MKTRILVSVAAILALAVAGSISSVWGEPQEPQRHNRVQQTSPMSSAKELPDQGNGMGGMNDTPTRDDMYVMMRVDSMMQRMAFLMERTQSYSKSFGALAAAHHGADQKEILMMQRMSDSMGMMAREIKVSLQQYKDMLEDETSSENGNMRAEVRSFEGVLDSIAKYIDGAVSTLQTLQEQLGQG